MKGKVLVIDGNNLLYRVFFSAMNSGEDKNGTAHVLRFLNTLKSYVELFAPTKVVVCWDFREGDADNYRKTLDPLYKAHRDKDKAEPVYRYMPVITQLLDSLGVYQINPKKLEADDIIFWLSLVKFKNNVTVVTTDTDMYQLVSNELPGNVVYNPQKKREISTLYLKEYYGVSSGLEFIIQKALKGDKADNLDGIKGLRKEKISQIITTLLRENNGFNTESLIKMEILKRDEAERFTHNLSLMKFDMNLITSEEIQWYEQCLEKTPMLSKSNFATIIKELEFWKIYKRLDYWFSIFDRVTFDDFEEMYKQFFLNENG